MRFRPTLRCRSVREVFLLVVGFTVLTYYISFHLSNTWWQVTSTGAVLSLHQQEVPGALKRSILSQFATQEKRVVVYFPSRPISDLPLSVRLEELLTQIEDQCLGPISSGPKVVLIRGQRAVIARDLPMYLSVLSDYHFIVHLPFWYNPVHNNTFYFGNDRDTEVEDPRNWHLFLCLTFTERETKPCLGREEYSKLHSYHKVNRFPGLRGILWKRDSLCYTFAKARLIPEVRRLNLVPTCYVMPTQYREFRESLGEGSWIIKSVTSGSRLADMGPKLLDIYTPSGLLDLEVYQTKRAVIQQFVPNILTVFGHPISARLYVLVTSLLPLRAYVHSEGLVHHRYDHHKNFRKITSRTWLLSDLWRYLSKNRSVEAVKIALSNLHSVLTQSLLVAEAVLADSTRHSNLRDKHKWRCRHCFHLLGIDVVFNSSLYPTIMEVNGQPNLQENRKEGRRINKIKRFVVSDMMTLLYEPSSVAREVTDAILESSDNIGVLELNCHVTSDMCLNSDDIRYILDSRRERLNQGGFRQLYPSSNIEKYEELINELERHFSDGDLDTDPGLGPVSRSPWQHTTSEFHRFLVMLERHYNRQSMDDDYTSGDATHKWKGDNLTKMADNWNYEEVASDKMSFQAETNEFPKRIKCSEDPSTMPYIASLSLEPFLNITPPFSPSISEYFVNVTYDLMLIKIGAISQNCQTEVRIDDKFGSSRPTNYTLGIGVNRISLLVVDVTHSEPWVINTYILLVRRLPITHGQPSFDPQQPHQICHLKQECEMQVFPSETCAIRKDITSVPNWSTYLNLRTNLTICTTGDASGRWVLPCTSCSDRKSCFWSEAVWHPYNCRYVVPSKDVLSRCLDGKKILFIGDSTNRGMMHYVMEKLNGSLNQWDKTHDIRVYTNVNKGRTFVSFAYYPQFWLPTNQRPVFDKALYQLIQRYQ